MGTPKSEAVKLEKVMGKISNIAQGPWMLPTNDVFERRMTRIMETYDLHSVFAFPGVPTDAPPDWTLNVDHLGDFLKSGTSSVDMIIKLLQGMQTKFSVPSCCKPVPKRIKRILVRMRKTAWQSFDAWRVNKGRTSDYIAPKTTSTTTQKPTTTTTTMTTTTAKKTEQKKEDKKDEGKKEEEKKDEKKNDKKEKEKEDDKKEEEKKDDKQEEEKKDDKKEEEK